MFGIILVLIGFVLLALAVAQHFMGLGAIANLTISHLAIYLGIAGLLFLLPGVWLTLRKGGN
jgi:hypothetical protein